MGPITYTPAVPDGPDRPWTRGRRTRWWLVVPADLVTVLVVAAFAAASLGDLARTGVLAAQGGGAVALGWLAGWVLARPCDHLEAVDRDSLCTVGVTYLVWLAACALSGGAVGDLWLMLASFLLVGMGGWRWLYGFVKAQESIVPKPIQRRLDAQERGED